MRPRLVSILAIAILSLSDVALALDVEHWIGPRPRIEDYQNREAFVTDVLAWQKDRDAVIELARQGALPEVEAKPADPRDWHTVTGPEDLNTAVMNASGYQQPVYKERRRFNRTTHISFPLQQLPVESLSSSAVNDSLGKPPATLETELPNELAERLSLTIEDPARTAAAPGLLSSDRTLHEIVTR
ncbi:MAG: hypothetical protein KAG82_13995 [Alcanivoracaceae bacterium]|jgi:hypothetical protein|nr:hypothetical protein [Alcanivoracaceae bacterium]